MLGKDALAEKGWFGNLAGDKGGLLNINVWLRL